MNYIIILLPKFGINFIHHELLLRIRQQFFYNNLTACHKELEVFLELMNNHCIIHVIHQDILDQLWQYILLDSFRWFTWTLFYPLKLAISKIATHCQTIRIIHIKVSDKFWRFFKVIIFHVFVICFTVSFSNVRNSTS